MKLVVFQADLFIDKIRAAGDHALDIADAVTLLTWFAGFRR